MIEKSLLVIISTALAVTNVLAQEIKLPENSPLHLSEINPVVWQKSPLFQYDKNDKAFIAGDKKVKVDATYSSPKDGSIIVTIIFTSNSDFYATIGCQGKGLLTDLLQVQSLELESEAQNTPPLPTAPKIAANSPTGIKIFDNNRETVISNIEGANEISARREPQWNHWLFRAMAKKDWGMIPLLQDQPYVLRFKIAAEKK